MTTNRSLRLRLEPVADDGRIAGRLYDERGERHDFSSWLGLLTLLEAARVRAGSPALAVAHRGATINRNSQETP